MARNESCNLYESRAEYSCAPPLSLNLKSVLLRGNHKLTLWLFLSLCTALDFHMKCGPSKERLDWTQDLSIQCNICSFIECNFSVVNISRYIHLLKISHGMKLYKVTDKH